MDLQIEGRTALITGATGGIGEHVANRLLEAGVQVKLTDLDGDEVETLAAKLGCEGFGGDLSSGEGVASLLDKTGTAFDILVHTAGITGAKGDPIDMSEDDWDHAMNIDFMSGVRLMRHLGRPMIDRGWGRVVFVTSENVAQPYPDETVYNASKSALLSFAKSVAMAHSGQGLLVNCVAPAFIETPMTDGMMKQRAEKEGNSVEETIETFLEQERPYLVLKRRGKPEEVAPVIALLCSELASFVTGSNWRVDGGSVGSIDI